MYLDLKKDVIFGGLLRSVSRYWVIASGPSEVQLRTFVGSSQHKDPDDHHFDAIIPYWSALVPRAMNGYDIPWLQTIPQT